VLGFKACVVGVSRVLRAQDSVPKPCAARFRRDVKRGVHRDRSELRGPRAIRPPIEIDRVGLGIPDAQEPGSAPRQLGAVFDTELGQERLDVKFYSSYRDVEQGGDFLVRAVAHDRL
jgi:hypothetical protein